MPASVMSVAGAALGPSPSAAIVRLPTSSGAWLTIHGSPLDGVAGRQAAVVIDVAQPRHLAHILMRAHGLTPREQEVTHLVLLGSSTIVAARQLEIAEDTVQKHLQSIFGKTGTRSRGELVSLLFQTHYEPRVRDNERRTAKDRPSRHGPMEAVSSSDS
jgi:DNA-binding CsgD family transcriptional regulator